MTQQNQLTSSCEAPRIQQTSHTLHKIFKVKSFENTFNIQRSNNVGLFSLLNLKSSCSHRKKSWTQILFTPMWSHQGLHNIFEEWHCIKSVPMRTFFWSVFFRIRTEYGEIRVFSPSAVKYEPEKNPCLDTFHIVWTIGTKKQ